MKSDEIKERMGCLMERLLPMQEEHARLERIYHDALSTEFIAANQITKDQIEPSDGEDKPWFGTISEFVKWLGWHPGKPWAEWNGRVYRTSDLLENRMPDTPAIYDHIAK